MIIRFTSGILKMNVRLKNAIHICFIQIVDGELKYDEWILNFLHSFSFSFSFLQTYSKTSSTPSFLRHLSCITCSSDNTIRFWSLNHGEADSYFAPSPVANIFSRQLMKIVYLDEDYSKLCDSQTTQGEYLSTRLISRDNNGLID